MVLPEQYLRYNLAPFVASRRGDVLRNMDQDQLFNLLVNKPDFMTPQQWHASGGQAFDPDGTLYAKYLSQRADKGLPLQPTAPQKPQMQANPNYAAPEGMGRGERQKLEDALAATQQPALVVKGNEPQAPAPKTSVVIPQMKANPAYAVDENLPRAERRKLEDKAAAAAQNTFNQQRNDIGSPAAGTYNGAQNALGQNVNDIGDYVQQKIENFKNTAAGKELLNYGDPTGEKNIQSLIKSAPALDAAEMAMRPSNLAATYTPTTSQAPSQSGKTEPAQQPYSQTGKFNISAAPASAAPAAEAPAATAPKLTQNQIDKIVSESGDTTFGPSALTPRATTAGTSSRSVTTSGTNQPTRTQSQQMYYYDPGDGGPIRMMGTSLPKGMSSGSQQGGGYIFGQDVPQNRTAAQKFVQGDATGVSSAVGDFFNKLTSKKPGTVDPLTGKSYEPVQQSDNVQTEARGGKVHSGSTSHDHKCHVGIIHMAVGGRTDHLPMNVYANSYVIPADVVSGMGEGNTLAGGKILDRMFSGEALRKLVNKSVKVPRKAGGGPLPISAPMQMGQLQVAIPEVMNFGPMDLEKTGPFGTELPTARANPKFPDARYSWRYTETPPGQQPKAGAAKGGMITDRHMKPVEILAAGGEYVIPPEVVRALGHGDAESGHKWLDNFVKSTRAHTIKTMQKLPGPRKD